MTRWSYHDIPQQVADLRDRAERAEAALAAATRDAERYRWLRVGRKGTYNTILIHAENALDQAIDAARGE